MRKLGIAVLAAALASGAAMAQDKSFKLTLAGASPGGLWSLLGVGTDRALKESFPGSTVTYQTSGGGIANVGLVEQKRAELGLVHDAELRLAVDGEPPFKTKASDVAAVANLYDWAPMQVVVTRDFAERHGLKTFEDIAAKKVPIRVVLNRRGNIAHMVAEQMFAAAGASTQDIEKWGGAVVLAGSEEQADLMRDRRVDALVNSLFVGQRSVVEIGQAVNVVMLPVGDATIQKVANAMGVGKFTIPAGSYAFQPEAVPTVTLGALMITRKSISDDVAYAVAKALVENIEQVRAVHPAMKALTPQFLTQHKTVPYHPGAVKYYKEKGLM